MLKPIIQVTGLIIAITLVAKHLADFLGLVNIAMIFLLPVLFGSVKWGLKIGVFAALAGVLVFDFFFVPPVLTFTVYDLRYLISFGMFLLIAFMIGRLSTRLREQIESSRKREAQTSALYSLSREIAAVSELDVVLQNVVRKITEISEGQVAILLPDNNGILALKCCSNPGIDPFFDERERTVAAWVYEHKQIAGKGTDTHSGVTGTYIPLISEQGICGVIRIVLRNQERYLQPEHQRLLEAFAGLTALAVSRISLVETAREAKLLSESDKLRTALLNSISHDLRTPLASMIGAVTSLLEYNHLYDEASRIELLQSIQQGAMRMNRLVNNLLDMARLESGMLKLNKDWCAIEEIIGAATKRLGPIIKDRYIKIDYAQCIPLINVDFVLIEQVVVNLLDNALKYSSPESKIVMNVRTSDKEMKVAVHDWGYHIPVEDLERIFDKFYRVRAPRQISGTGLGLAISKGIIELHDGKIWAENCPDDSVSITFVLPLELNAPEISLNMGALNHGSNR
ncbi:MAG: DUF4118 domain-containing protein [Desulfitobacterium hafniense]|nr:DUF4118 domain-containing protein [Desulfitobacterium hafniense]